MRKIKIALIQMRALPHPDGNLEQAVRAVQKAAEGGARVICLQELFRTFYFCRTENQKNFKWAETIPGPATKVLSKIAAAKRVVIIAPIFEKRTEGIYHNSAVVIDADGEMLGTYRKMHIPDDPHFYEKFYFSPGDLGFQVFSTRYGRVGVLICWDQWFPEAARLTALQGAQIIFYPSAIGSNRSDPAREIQEQKHAWEIIQRGHAIANGVYVAALNRVGREGALEFWGNSFVSDPFGRILARTGSKAGILTAVCDLEKIEDIRQQWPFLRDRRIDAYGEISARLLDHHKNKKKV